MDSGIRDLAQPVNLDEFWRDGRGPELRRVVWNADGTVILAIEYLNPDWTNEETDLRHVIIKRPQAVQITPEEVVSPDQYGTRYVDHPRAAMFDLGRSDWLESFMPTHLVSSRHVQMLFYEQLIDVVCDGVRCAAGEAPHKRD